MKAQPLMFLGDRRRAALLARMETAARRWRQSWASRAGESFDANCESPAAAGFNAPVASVAISAWELTANGERVAVLLLPHSTFAWCVHEAGGIPLDGSTQVAAGSLGEHLEQEVARSLLLEACAVDARETANVGRAAPGELGEWSRAARAWKLQVKSDGGRTFTLLVSAARIEKLAPARPASPAVPLVGLREAVGENTVTLRAVIGETGIPVVELAELAPGDVLVLEQLLSDPVAVVCGNDAAMSASLGRAGARRAVKITRTN